MHRGRPSASDTYWEHQFEGVRKYIESGSRVRVVERHMRKFTVVVQNQIMPDIHSENCNWCLLLWRRWRNWIPICQMPESMMREAANLLMTDYWAFYRVSSVVTFVAHRVWLLRWSIIPAWLLCSRVSCFINIFFRLSICSVDYDESGRPANLANSAVLKYLEEEEEEKRNAGKQSQIHIGLNKWNYIVRNPKTHEQDHRWLMYRILDYTQKRVNFPSRFT